MQEIYKQVQEKINEFENIIIAKHENPDGDAFGSAVGLYYLIRDNFKNKKIFLVGQEDKKNIDIFNNEIDENVVKNSLLITVDTANFERIDFNKKTIVKNIFKIDHHVLVDDYASWNYVIEDAIACCEVITILANELNWKISKLAAENLYLGLITDSNRFMYKNTSERTFEAAKILKSTGINIQNIYKDLYSSSLKFKKWKAHVMLNSISDNGVVYYVASKDDIKNWIDDNINFNQWKSIVNIFDLTYEAKIWMFIYPKEDGLYGVSLRSSDYNLLPVALKFEGGGHNLACGAKLKSLEQIPFLLNELKKIIV